jgi:hypothetical protein
MTPCPLPGGGVSVASLSPAEGAKVTIVVVARQAAERLYWLCRARREVETEAEAEGKGPEMLALKADDWGPWGPTARDYLLAGGVGTALVGRAGGGGCCGAVVGFVVGAMNRDVFVELAGFLGP